METRNRWILAAGTAVLAAIIAAAAIAQAARQHSLDPIWMAGWLPAVLVAVYPAVTGRARQARKPCHARLRRSGSAAPPAVG